MKKNKRNSFLIVAGILVVLFLVSAATVATVFAYRQFNGSGQSSQTLLISSDEGEFQQDESDVSGEREVGLGEKGVLVTGVDPAGPAAAAGIRRGSIILEMNGLETNNFQELNEAINQHEAGETVELTVLNCDFPEEIPVTLASSAPYLGVKISGHSSFQFNGDFEYLPGFPGKREPGMRDLPLLPEEFFEIPKHFDELPDEFFDLPRHFDEVPDENNLVLPAIILYVLPDTPADEAGLQAFDIIKSVNGKAITSREEVVETILSQQPGDQVAIVLDRDGETLELNVTLGENPEAESQAYLGVHLGMAAFHREINRFENEQNS